MTIFLASLLLAQSTTAPPPSGPDADEVTVLAQRLKRFRAVTRKDRKTGATICVVERESGDPALDKGVCDALLACARKITRESEIQPCMEPAMKALVPKLTWIGKRARRPD